ncbi:alpha/beta hydrolase [Solihabitans fulvus]|uniref:Alpha/beta hydrolase n=1 Tax=Solihabitans fulvus TaxID=1892852 RepID=A0A5B2WVD2_9PSEU|nr:alpha/beta hydrolase [Solihabitans fulvus]KAA2254436.1 alpha/beta hydrolase [Solihabitans fulvus]
MADIAHRHLDSNGLRTHIAEAGSGPLVLLLHGFLNYSYSWRHQLRALADAGYHAVAPDLRGYGDTDRPDAVEEYTQLHLAGDVVGLLDALGERSAVVVGHDWGSMIAWTTALLRPDRVRGVVGLSVPYVPRGRQSLLSAMRSRFGDGYYMQYFQEAGRADRELARDVAATFRSVLYSGSASASEPWNPVVPTGGGWLDVLPDPGVLPPWLTESDLAAYVETFERTGFTGGLNWYRALDLSWELMAAWHDAPVTAPALFAYGAEDSFARYAAQLIEALPASVPDLRASLALPGCGHWVQQEKPEEVNRALLGFLNELG